MFAAKAANIVNVRAKVFAATRAMRASLLCARVGNGKLDSETGHVRVGWLG